MSTTPRPPSHLVKTVITILDNADAAPGIQGREAKDLLRGMGFTIPNTVVKIATHVRRAQAIQDGRLTP